MKKEILFHRKDFLNLDGYLSDASIFSRISIEMYYAGESGREEARSYVSSELKIRDCDKTVYLDIDVETPKNTLNTLHKIDVLINHLQQLKQAIHDKN